MFGCRPASSSNLLQSAMPVVAVELVIAAHIDHRALVEALAHDPAYRVGHARHDVPRDHHDIVRRARIGEHERVACIHVKVQVGNDPELHAGSTTLAGIGVNSSPSAAMTLRIVANSGLPSPLSAR